MPGKFGLSPSLRAMTSPLVLLLTCAILGTGATASAHYLAHHDANDTQHQLDIRRVVLEIDHEHRHGKLIVRVRTFGRFRMADDGSELVEVRLDTRGGSRLDATIGAFVDRASGGALCQITYRSGRAFGCKFQTRHRSARIDLRLGKLSRNKHLRWAVRTSVNARVLDSAPDLGLYAH